MTPCAACAWRSAAHWVAEVSTSGTIVDRETRQSGLRAVPERRGRRGRVQRGGDDEDGRLRIGDLLA